MMTPPRLFLATKNLVTNLNETQKSRIVATKGQQAAFSSVGAEKKLVESTQYDKFLLQLIFHVEQKAFLRSLADSVNLINCLKLLLAAW